MIELINANALHIPLADESVHAVVTSPPYYALRSYSGTATWEGGDAGCDHAEKEVSWSTPLEREQKKRAGEKLLYRDICGKCGATRHDGQLGLEKRADCLGWATGQPCGECYICQMVAVFREVKRVLRKDGTCFLNIGDSYANTKVGNTNEAPDKKPRPYFEVGTHTMQFRKEIQDGLKPKDMMLIPQRLALALQAPYPLPRLMKNDIDRSWLAAFVDGEGTISIRHQSEKGSNGEPCNDGYVPFLSAGNNDTELLDHCVEITGYGSVRLKDHPHIDDRGIISRRDYMGWRIESNKATEVISEIYPFLIAKRKQAILAYTLDLSNKGGRALRGNKALPTEEQEKRAYLKELINKCNQRELVDLPDWCIEPETKQRFEPGWYIRSDIIWAKPNPMPESVTDRPTKSHEYIWLLSKSKDYFWDQEAVKEGISSLPANIERRKYSKSKGHKTTANPDNNWEDGDLPEHVNSRNLRTVWNIATQPYSGAHYATYPEELVLRCLKAATSERGCCPKCGKMWEREVERDDKRHWTERNEYTNSKYQLGNNISGRDDGRADFAKPEFRTLGFLPGCACDLPPVPATILDPFAGSGTTLLVAKRMGLNAVGLDLSYQYLRENAWERVGMGQPVMV